MGNAWARAYSLLRDYVVRINTEHGNGSGVLVSTSDHAYGIATARHVIEDSLAAKKQIRVHHVPSGHSEAVVTPRALCYLFKETDLALMVLHKGCLELPEPRLRLMAPDQRLSAGSSVAWCGYPYFSQDELCIFRGSICCRKQTPESYLIDGVAVSGVSGGPVFVLDEDPERPPIIVAGIATAYMPNRAGGSTEALPGVTVAQPVAPLINIFRDMNAQISVTHKRRV
jgi:hypothetical protein